jgi:single-stranded-DNA-specific exonuclease
VAGFNVMEALNACRDLLAQYGGHAQAAGFAVKRDKIDAFRERLREWARQIALAEPAEGPPVLTVDAEVTLSDVSLEVHDRLAELEPCGAGFAAPMFLCRHVRLHDYRVVGNNHLRLALGSPRRMVGAIAFGQGELARQLSREQLLDVVFSIEANEWNGDRTVQLKVRDLAPANGAAARPRAEEQQTAVVP